MNILILKKQTYIYISNNNNKESLVNNYDKNLFAKIFPNMTVMLINLEYCDKELHYDILHKINLINETKKMYSFRKLLFLTSFKRYGCNITFY